MAPIHASKEDIERGARLAAWLDQVAEHYPKYLRGEKIFQAPRQTVASWIKGADISNAGIARILEIGGVEAIEKILDVQANDSRGEDSRLDDKSRIHGKSIKFWYLQYVRERAKGLADGSPDYSGIPHEAIKALEKADAQAIATAKSLRASCVKKPRIKKYDFPE